MAQQELEEKLIVGAKIKFGKEYCETHYRSDLIDKTVELVEGHFEYDNGLYTVDDPAHSIWEESINDFSSIYHLFGNDLSDFMDCEIVN